VRDINFNSNKYYRIYTNGWGGQKIFYDDEDRVRFLFLLLHFQSPTPINNTGYYARRFLKTGNFGVGEKKKKEILKTRYLEIISFSLASDNFHILVRNLKDQIVSVYMHRILTSFSKYFNSKYKKSGHVFNGPFKANQIKNIEQLLNVSVLLHKNLNETEAGTISAIPERNIWSSFNDFTGTNRWGDLLATDAITKHFKNKSSYQKFVLTSEAKNLYF